MQVRLQRFLSMAGVAARRKAEGMIVAGRVAVNGEVVTELGTKVDPRVDHVTVDGQEVQAEEPFYVLLNKPKGCITAVSDDRGRRTVMEYLPNLPVKVAPVGRLDYYSEGVLLLTNDGELSAALQSPDRHVEKTYHVKFRGQVDDEHVAAWCSGVRLDDGRKTRPAKVTRLPSESRHDWFEITLTEGRSRQIHRMAEAFGYQVLKLQRVAFGGITFHGLRVGDARELTQDEVNQLRVAAGLPGHGRQVARGQWKVLREQSERNRRIGNHFRRERGDGTPGAGDRKRGERGDGTRGAGDRKRGDGTRGAGDRKRGERGDGTRGAGERKRGKGRGQRGGSRRR